MKFILAFLLSAITTVISFWPTWLWLGLHHIAHPVGFWQNMATAGIGVVFLLGLQVTFLGLGVACIFMIIATIYDL